MAEYIEKESLMVALCKEITGEGDYYNGKDDMQDQIRDMVSQFPAADVASVRHGRWVLDEYARYFRCSACGTQFDDETDTYCNIMNGFAPNYCEDCGAKMDGGDTDAAD